MAEIKIYGTLLNDTAEPIVYAEQITVKETGENLLDLINNGNSVTVEGKCVLPFAGVRDDVTLEASSHSGAEGEHYYASNLKKFVHSPSGGVSLPGETAKHYISYDYNDCSNGAPDGPMTDKIYLNTTDHKLYVWNGTELVVVGVSASDVEAAKEKWIDVFMPFDTFIANGEVLDEANFSIESSLVNYTRDYIKGARGFRILDGEGIEDYDLNVIQAFRAYISDDMAEDYFYGSYRGKMVVFEFNGTDITTHAKYNIPRTWEFTGSLLTSKPVAPSGFFANAKVGDRVAIWNDSNKKNLKYIGTVIGEQAGSHKHICVIAGLTTYLFSVYSDNSVVSFMKGGTLANKQETLTQSAYDALTTKDADTTYFITE